MNCIEEVELNQNEKGTNLQLQKTIWSLIAPPWWT
jgi:hypothetical protein